MNLVISLLIRAIILVVLILVALIVSAIVKKIVLKLFNVGKLKEQISKLDADDIDADSELSFINIFGDLAYWFTFLLFLIPILTFVGLSGIATEISGFISTIVAYIPSVIFAVVIIVLGFLIANFLRRLVYVLLVKTRVNELVQKVTFEEDGKISIDIPKIVSWTVYGLIILIFITQALDLFGLAVLTNISMFLLGLVPAVLASLVIFIGAYILGNFLGGVIRNAFNNTKESKIIGSVVRYFILIMGLGLVLNQLGFDIMLLNITYIILLLAVGVAAAIAFGVAGIEIAKKILTKQYEKFDK